MLFTLLSIEGFRGSSSCELRSGGKVSLKWRGTLPRTHPANSMSGSFPGQMFVEHLLWEMPVRSAGERERVGPRRAQQYSWQREQQGGVTSAPLTLQL